jgi:hypothetical protein
MIDDLATLEMRAVARLNIYPGRIYKALGSLTNARQEFTRALKLNPSEIKGR